MRLEACHRRSRVIQNDAADFLGQGRAAGLAGHHVLNAAAAQSAGQARDLRGLADPLDPLDGQKTPRGCAHRGVSAPALRR